MSGGATFRSLRERNYRLYFAGSLVANTGSWMGRTAQSWLVLTELTHLSSQALGWVTAAQFLPMVLLAPWAGMIADRFRKREVLLLTQIGMGLSLLILGLLTLFDLVTLSHVYLLAFVMGVFAAVDGPARQTFVSEIVGPDLLANAVGLNSANFNAARLLGPAVAGVLIASVGTGWVLVINAVSFSAVLASLLMLDMSTVRPAPLARGRGQIRAGLAYVARRPDIILIMGIVFLQGALGMNFQMTNALMATQEFGRGPSEFGLLGSILAIGSLTAALSVARRDRPRLRTILAALAAFAVSMTAAAVAPSYEIFAVLLIPVGFFALTILPTANSLVQLSVEPEMRGRVMALYLAIFLGGTPAGAPLLGWVGDTYGARWTLAVGALGAVLALGGALTYLLGFGGIRVRYRVHGSPHWVVRRPEDAVTPLPEITN